MSAPVPSSLKQLSVSEGLQLSSLYKCKQSVCDDQMELYTQVVFGLHSLRLRSGALYATSSLQQG